MKFSNSLNFAKPKRNETSMKKKKIYTSENFLKESITGLNAYFCNKTSKIEKTNKSYKYIFIC